jgi:hypothetical protein
MRPFGAAMADSTSKGRCMTWLVPEMKYTCAWVFKKTTIAVSLVLVFPFFC